MQSQQSVSLLPGKFYPFCFCSCWLHFNGRFWEPIVMSQRASPPLLNTLPTHLSQINDPLTGVGTSLSPPSTSNNAAPVSAEGCKHRANRAAFPDAWRRWRLLGVSLTHLTRNATTKRIPITEPRGAPSRVHTWLSADIYARTVSFSLEPRRDTPEARVLASSRCCNPSCDSAPNHENRTRAPPSRQRRSKRKAGVELCARNGHNERAGKVCGEVA